MRLSLYASAKQLYNESRRVSRDLFLAAIPQHLVDEILAKCCRHCCVCRRFEPLHLQVHHIIPRAEGGSDDLDNLIAVCLTCHCDVHTRTLFTRRFTPGELRLHREAVFALVSNGKLPIAYAPQDAPVAVIASTAIERLTEPVIQPDTPALTLSQTAVEILIAAATSEDGVILLLRSMGGSAENLRTLRAWSRRTFFYRFGTDPRPQGRAVSNHTHGLRPRR